MNQNDDRALSRTDWPHTYVSRSPNRRSTFSATGAAGEVVSAIPSSVTMFADEFEATDLTMPEGAASGPARSFRKGDCRFRKMLGQLLAAWAAVECASRDETSLARDGLGRRSPLNPTSYRYASDSRNAPENCGLLRPLSICGAKKSLSFPRTFGIDRLDADVLASVFEECSSHSWSSKIKAGPSIFLGALQSELPPPWQCGCLKSVCAPQCFDFKSYFFVWWESWANRVISVRHRRSGG